MVRKVSLCQIYKGWWYKSCSVLHIKLTNRALYPVIYCTVCGCQSSTWSTGQDKIRGSSTKLQREHENKNKTKNKGTITQSTCQKTIEEGHCKEVQRSTCHIRWHTLCISGFFTKFNSLRSSILLLPCLMVY